MEPRDEKWIVRFFSDEGTMHLLQEDRLTQTKIVDAISNIWEAISSGLSREMSMLNMCAQFPDKSQEWSVSVKIYIVDYRNFVGLNLIGPWSKDDEDVEQGQYTIELNLLSDGKTLRCDRDLLSFWGRTDTIFVNHTIDKVRKSILNMLSLRSEVFCGQEILSIVGDVNIRGMY